MPTDDTTLLTTKDAAERIGVSHQTITRWVRDGQLKPAMQGPGLRGAMFFTADDVDAMARGEASA